MNRDKVIDELLEKHEAMLDELYDDELFGAERLKEIMQRQLEVMRDKEIETQLEAERERLEALSDEEMASLIDEEEALLKEFRNELPRA